jgi:hypothetical protein
MKRILVLLLLVMPSFMVLSAGAMKLEPAEQKSLNVFFSNFSEADLKSFTPQTLSDDLLLDFALAHNLINRVSSLEKSRDGNSVIVTSAQIDKTTEKYFGKKVAQHHRQTYTRPLAEGEAYTFSQLSSLTDLGGHLYLANGVIYRAGSGATPNPQGTPAQWKKAGEEVEPCGSFIAKIKSVGERYILLEYHVVSN